MTDETQTLSPDKRMKVTMVLADHAQIAEGKLFISGGGWTETGPTPVPFAIAVLFEVPWNETNKPHTFQLELIDSHGEPVMVPTPGGDEPLKVEGQFEVGRPPGARPGSSFTNPFVFKCGGLPMASATSYEWRLLIDDETRDDWRLVFNTRPEAQAQVG